MCTASWYAGTSLLMASVYHGTCWIVCMQLFVQSVVLTYWSFHKILFRLKGVHRRICTTGAGKAEEGHRQCGGGQEAACCWQVTR